MARMNRIIAKGISGIFKDSEIEIQIGKDSFSSKILVYGKEIKGIYGAHIHIRAGKPTQIVLEKSVEGEENVKS